MVVSRKPGASSPTVKGCEANWHLRPATRLEASRGPRKCKVCRLTSARRPPERTAWAELRNSSGAQFATARPPPRPASHFRPLSSGPGPRSVTGRRVARGHQGSRCGANSSQPNPLPHPAHRHSGPGDGLAGPLGRRRVSLLASQPVSWLGSVGARRGSLGIVRLQ